jgi:hypothetical protein
LHCSAAGLAAKTVKNLLLRADHKRRGLFAVERTISPKIPSRPPQGQVRRNQFDDIGFILDFFDETLRNHSFIYADDRGLKDADDR